MQTEKRPRPLKSGEAGTANFRGTRDVVPEAQSKISLRVTVPIPPEAGIDTFKSF